MPGEVNGCIGCHENRLNIPPATPATQALRRKPNRISEWVDPNAKNFSYVERVQPILDRSCVKCHDFDRENRDKLVLAGDKNPYFNASYINLYVSKSVDLVGAGGANIMQAYSWGSHKSMLSEVIENRHSAHPKVTLSVEDVQTLYTWMDINGVYYPTYATPFDNTAAGRSPMNDAELKELGQLTGLNFLAFRLKGGVRALNTFQRVELAQISFERPEQSPCLDVIRSNEAKYKRAVELIKMGQARLKETPRGDIETELVLSDRNKEQMANYVSRIDAKSQNSCNIDISKKRYDKQ